MPAEGVAHAADCGDVGGLGGGTRGVLSLVVGLAAGAVPESWGWAHNWWLLLGIGLGLLVAAALVAVVQARSAPGGVDGGGPSWSMPQSSDRVLWRVPMQGQ